MCGIAGTFTGLRTGNTEQTIRNAQQKLSHRGPDDAGIERFDLPNGALYLAHTRLSILDLSSLGHQPMSSEDGQYSITFNGEIYNYKELRQELTGLGYSFRSDCDTEVLIYSWIHWGETCLKKFIGMFSFALLDRKKNTLFCARDAFGIKPFFYQTSTVTFSFASELQALLELLKTKPQLNFQRCYNYLVFGVYDQDEQTFFRDIHQLLPGHLMQVDLNLPEPVVNIKRWWWPAIDERTDISFENAAGELRERFLQNVRLHLRSDVPLGAALSGGIDSSAIVCAMRHLEPDMPIHTFSYVARGSSVDEEKWIDLVNNYVGAVPHKVFLTADELISDLDDLMQTQGEPFGSTSIYAQYRVFKKAKESGITVTLDGQGADELLAGYDGYPISRFKSLLEKKKYGTLLTQMKGWRATFNKSRSETVVNLRSALVHEKIRLLAEKFGHKPSISWMKGNVLKQIGILRNIVPAPGDKEFLGRQLVNSLRNALTQHSLQSLLRHGDRNSMRWSVESRVPFLTTELAEYLLHLPEEYLLSERSETKNVFRKAMRGIVPDAILDRKDKIGFQTPETEMLQSIRPEITESLHYLSELSFIDIDALRKEVNAAFDQNKVQSMRMWQIFNLGRFIGLHGVNTETV